MRAIFFTLLFIITIAPFQAFAGGSFPIHMAAHKAIADKEDIVLELLTLHGVNHNALIEHQQRFDYLLGDCRRRYSEPDRCIAEQTVIYDSLLVSLINQYRAK